MQESDKIAFMNFLRERQAIVRIGMEEIRTRMLDKESLTTAQIDGYIRSIEKMRGQIEEGALLVEFLMEL